jgi:multiple sugar transport system ATP-binding protein
MASIRLAGITKRFGTVTAVDHVSLEISSGEFFVILGPSGAGKTTTLRLIAGLEQPDLGDILVDDQAMTDVHPAERDMAFIFQQYSLYPHLSVFDNLAFPLRSPRRRLDASAIRTKVVEVAQMLHIEQKLNNRSTTLSGGEMQRVAIGRALVREPKVFLMDEPLSSLDAKLREELRQEIRRLQRRIGATTLYVTHDQVEATTMADRIGILERGKLIQVGSPREIYNNPRSLSAAQRLGSPPINLIAANTNVVPGLPASVHTLAIRPEDIAITSVSGDSTFELTVQEYSPLRNLLILNGGATELVAVTNGDQVHQAGEKLMVSLPRDRLLYFDADGRRIPS